MLFELFVPADGARGPFNKVHFEISACLHHSCRLTTINFDLRVADGMTLESAISNLATLS